MKTRYTSIILKIVGLIIAAQAATLLLLGIFNVSYFGRKIESRFISQIKVPGNLISNNALRYNAVNDPAIMETFAGRDIEDAVLIGTDNIIYYSLDPLKIDTPADAFPLIDRFNTDTGISKTQVVKIKDNGKHYIVCITPVVSESGKFLGRLFIKAGTAQLEQEKLVITYIFAAGSLIALIIIIFMGLAFSKKFSHKIGHLVDLLKNIAQGEGDLTKRITLSSNDELGEIALYYNMFAEKLEHIIARLKLMVINLSSASSQLSVSSNAISTNTHEQAAQIQSIASNVYQVTDNLNTLVETSNNVVGQAQKSMEYSKQGKKLNDELMGEMKNVLLKEQEFSQDLEDLWRNSNKITKIISVVSEITDQTNLVALNASIQASRTNSNVKGFAVVAGEIRDLAKKTQESTRNISEIIKSIQNKIHAVVKAMHGNVAMMEAVSKNTDLAADMNEKISSTNRLTLSMVDESKRSFSEHNTAMDSIQKNMGVIDSASTETARSISDMTETISTMTQEVEEIREVIDRFIVRDTTE